jgi:hypothetical protein
MLPKRFQLAWEGLMQTTIFILLLFGVICTKTIESASCHHMWLHQTMKATDKTFHTHYTAYKYML